jgi:hypothetical protein
MGAISSASSLDTGPTNLATIGRFSFLEGSM